MKKTFFIILTLLASAILSIASFAQSEMIIYANSGLTCDGTYISNLPDGITGDEFSSRIKDSTKLSFKDASGSAMNVSDIVKTGEVLVYDNSEEYILSVLGDVSGDGKITSADFLKLKSYFKGTLTLEGAYMKAADADGNGKISSTDAIAVKKYFTGRKLVNALPKMTKKFISHEIIRDSSFENGFTILSQQTNGAAAIPLGNWTYNEDTVPTWELAQWSSGKCLWEDRVDDGNKYTITDGSSKWVTYDPEDKSISLRLNAADVYKGQPAGGSNWPHLLIEAGTEIASCDADRIYLSFDVRLVDYKPTTNPAGINAVQINPFIYLKAKDKTKFIWFGASVFDDRGPTAQSWQLDASSGNMIYGISNTNTYGKETQLTTDMGWVHVNLNIRPYIDHCCYLANTDGTYGSDIKASDFEITGTNFGFETHGNIDCTFAIRNYSIQIWNEDK